MSTIASGTATRERPRDVFQTWFSELEAIGECSQFRLAHCTSQQAPEWYLLPHQDFDGIGGLCHVLRQHHGLELCLPEIAERAPAAFWRWLAAARGLLRPRARPMRWRNIDLAWKAPPGRAAPTAFAWALLSAEETSTLREMARQRHISLNAWLLSGLSRALLPQLVGGSGNLHWVVPVNMRGADQRLQPTSNQASTLEVRFAATAHATQIDALLRRERRRRAHWGVWQLLSILKHMGAPAIRRAARREAAIAKHGSFSNLGNLHAQPNAERTTPDDWWLAFNTVQRSRPVGAACLTWNGRLAITLQLHPALSRDPATAHAWLFAWLEQLLAER